MIDFAEWWRCELATSMRGHGDIDCNDFFFFFFNEGDGGVGERVPFFF